MLSRITFPPVVFALLTVAAAAADKLDFSRDIRPVLADNCFACHGPDANKRQGALRLDLRDEATKPADSGEVAIVPNNTAKSELVRRIFAEDEAERMPPADSQKKLTADQKALLKRWIDEGAPYAQHWSFVPPVKATLPAVKQAEWAKNEIDRFVLAQLEAKNLAPSAPADTRALIRRLALDLTGLPPSTEEVEAFATDSTRTGTPAGISAQSAIRNLIDRLLDSPHFGERLAIDWLDAARYADTNGFSIDGGRHMWLWRDWVIQAFNSNMPYDQFLVEQLAGDLLPNPTPSQLIATGFQRNNMVTHEGGTIPEENLTNYNVDRVKTLGEAVLGLTLACAQCHDHKYDPLTQRDYYGLFAYFNAASDIGLDGNGGKNPRPVYMARTVLAASDRAEVERQIAQFREKLVKLDEKALAAWEQEQRQRLAKRGEGLALHPTEVLKVSTPNRGAGWEVEFGRYVNITQPSDLVAYDLSLRLPETEQPINGVRVVFHASGYAPGDGWGYGPSEVPARRNAKAKAKAASAAEKPDFKGNFVLTAFSASADAVPGDQVNLHRLLPVERVTANTWQEEYPPADCLDPRNENGWSPAIDDDGNLLIQAAPGKDPSSFVLRTSPFSTPHLTVTFAEPLAARETPYATVQLNFGNGRSQVASRFEVLAMTGTDDGSELPAEIIDIVTKPAGERSAEEHDRLKRYFAAHAEPTRRMRIDLANLEERLAVLTNEFPTMVMDVAEKPRETFILNRGDYSQPTEKVEPGTPAALPPLQVVGTLRVPSATTPSNRLALAQWIVMRDNPLTARVYVNRVWQMLFGVGLVKTAADFGTQGEYPSHPELLDWLAVDFMDSGWDVKRLVKTIVSSATYQQSSANSELRIQNAESEGNHSEFRILHSAFALDPDNRLLWRGPRFRLPAELIRDSALKISGLLTPRIGGPSVNPYTPGDPWREISHYGSTPATAQTFVQDHGEKLYRRSLYTYWKRTAPPPNMTVFDAPNRETCVVNRASTTTPLQALTLLNDVQFVEASRAFAERILTAARASGRREPPGNVPLDDAQRLRWAFTECTSRPPTETELAVLTKTLARERERYKRDPNSAAAFLALGESPRSESLAASEHAAWSQVALLLLNLSETVTRN
jgi:hypothetical protein